jgi:hypothetical protein
MERKTKQLQRQQVQQRLKRSGSVDIAVFILQHSPGREPEGGEDVGGGQDADTAPHQTRRSATQR